jgi:hypothetical protein
MPDIKDRIISTVFGTTLNLRSAAADRRAPLSCSAPQSQAQSYAELFIFQDKNLFRINYKLCDTLRYTLRYSAVKVDSTVPKSCLCKLIDRYL